MTNQRISLRKIAELCELAPTTVSSILHGRRTYCSQAKIERVQELVKQYNYRPSIGYNIMTGRSTNIVAVVFSQKRVTQHDLLQKLYMALCMRLNEQNYAMYTAIMPMEWDEQKASLDALAERGCRAFIFIGAPRNYDKIREHLEELKLQILGLNNLLEPNGVFGDQNDAYARYLKMLDREGRTDIRIAFPASRVSREFLPHLDKKRHAYYLSCCMDVPHVGYVPGESARHYYRLGYEQMREEYLRNPGIEAIIFPSDYHALGAAAALLEMGSSPEKVELFGMGDSVATPFTGIRLTTTHFDVDSLVNPLMDKLVSGKKGVVVVKGEIIRYPLADGNLLAGSLPEGILE